MSKIGNKIDANDIYFLPGRVAHVIALSDTVNVFIIKTELLL